MQFLKYCSALPSFGFIGESRGCLDILDRISTSSKVSSDMIHDAKMAAIRIHHGVSE